MERDYLQVTGRIFDIQKYSIHDGPGIRTTFLCQGCPHHCEGCHNPQTHPFEGGTEKAVEEIFEDIKKNPLLSGVTFSGGEPFCQAGELAKLGEYIVQNRDLRADEELNKHADWVDSFKPNYDNITAENVDEILQYEVGQVLKKVLEHAGVYKRNQEGRNAFDRFMRVVQEG